MRIVLPSYLKHAGGRIGDIVLYGNYGNNYARKYTIPLNPDTEGQKIIRKTFGDAVRSWQELSDNEKHKYRMKAWRLPINGYNLYISLYMKKNIPRTNEREDHRGLTIPFPVSTHRAEIPSPSVAAALYIKNRSDLHSRRGCYGSSP